MIREKFDVDGTARIWSRIDDRRRLPFVNFDTTERVALVYICQASVHKRQQGMDTRLRPDTIIILFIQLW